MKVIGTLCVSNLNCSQQLMATESFMASNLMYFLPSSDFSSFCAIKEISSSSFVEDLTMLPFPEKSRPLSFQHFPRYQRYKGLLKKKKKVKCNDLTTDTAWKHWGIQVKHHPHHNRTNSEILARPAWTGSVSSQSTGTNLSLGLLLQEERPQLPVAFADYQGRSTRRIYLGQ